jgi:cytochrome c biogenesis protein ResB
VGVFRVRDNEAKNYYSTLSILKNDRVVATKQIYVNEPMFYEGWAFYQANYDPQNLLYSGIEAVRDPGLPLVYLGLTLMMLGVFQIFYLRTLRRQRQVAE